MEIINKKIEDLKPYEKNPRKNDDAVKYVKESISRFGFKVPIIIDKDGVIIAGHTRYKASQELGIKEVPCIVADDLTEEQIKAFRIADNKVAEKSSWDLDLLNEEFEELNLEEFDMTDFGFGEFEISMLTTDVEPEVYDDDEIKEYIDKSDDYLVSKRVIFTYSTEEEEEYLKKLLNTDKLRVVYKVEEIINESYSD